MISRKGRPAGSTGRAGQGTLHPTGYDRRMSNQLRLGIVGVGRMGAFHARTVAPSPLIDLVAVADLDTAAATAIAEEIGAQPTDFDALLAAQIVDAVLIATPTASHPALVRRAIDAGVDVLCEKPLSLDLGESRELAQYADKMGRLLQIGFWRRFSPPWATAKRLLDAGAIGRPLMIRLSQWDADPPPAEFCDPAKSGGLAIDCGVHEYDLAEWFTEGRVQSVSSFPMPIVSSALAETGDIDNLLAVLEMSDGVVATVDLSRNCRYGDDVRTEILGENGAIFIDLLPVGRTRLATADGVVEIGESVTEDAFGAGIRNQAEAFARAVAGEQVDVPLALTSTRSVEIGNAIRQSTDLSQPVAIP